VASFLRRSLLLVAQVALSFLVVEAGYRAYWSYAAPEALVRLLLAQTPAPASLRGPNAPPVKIPDQYSGYRYAPNREGDIGTPWFSHWKTNSHGHMSAEEYPVRKPPDEFRIAAVGDSFTANITSNVSWTDELQKTLNASPAWKAHVGGKFTRVINFGLDGTGFEQFAGMVRHHVPAFEPDLILVNFMSDDFLRRKWGWTKNPPATREEGLRKLVSEFVGVIDWFEPCSLVLSSLEGWQWGGACARIPVDLQAFLVKRSRELYRHATREEAIEKSAAALRAMMSAPNVVFLHQPAMEETEGIRVEEWVDLLDATRREVTEWRFVPMLARMEELLEGKRARDRTDLAGWGLLEIAALPDERKPENYRWFYIPKDTHWTDYGNHVYAGVVARALLELYPPDAPAPVTRARFP